MADEQVVDSTVDTGSPNDGNTPDSNSPEKPAAAQKPAPASVNSGWEAEKRGILADISKERKARQEYERQVSALTAERDQERRRVQALAGVNPQSTEETEADAVRQRFGQIFPGLAKLTDKQIEKLLSVAEKADGLEEATNSQWQRHGRQMLDSVVAAATKSIGGTLTDRQATRLKQAYVQEAESNPEFLARHEQGDPTLIDEFIKNWNEDWFEPARRNAAQAEVNRQRRVPSARDRSVIGQGGKKIDFSNEKSFGDALVESFKGHGGGFGE